MRCVSPTHPAWAAVLIRSQRKVSAGAIDTRGLKLRTTDAARSASVSSANISAGKRNPPFGALASGHERLANRTIDRRVLDGLVDIATRGGEKPNHLTNVTWPLVGIIGAAEDAREQILGKIVLGLRELICLAHAKTDRLLHQTIQFGLGDCLSHFSVSV